MTTTAIHPRSVAYNRKALVHGYYDIAPRGFGLLLAALTLARLASALPGSKQ